MSREEYLTAAGVFFERTLLPVKDMPADRLIWPLAEGSESALELYGELARRAERMVRALELLYHGADADELLATPYQVSSDTKRSQAHYRIAHSTVIAALERVPEARLHEHNELPEWMLTEYLQPLEQAAIRIERWSAELRGRGQAGPTGLPVIQ